MKILIFGLPGSGKTYLAQELLKLIGHERADWHNADDIREECEDWDFSELGRERQLQRMRVLAQQSVDRGKIAICDFICPLRSFRELFDADYYIWVNTVGECDYEDTNQMFEAPEYPVSYEVKEKRGDHDARRIVWDLVGKDFNPKAPTAQMLGRFQPWHDGHQALFERAMEKEGQVCVMIRNMESDDDNPYVAGRIHHDLLLTLAPWAGKVQIMTVPNLTRISYGRDVGYTIEQEYFGSEIESISATDIRQRNKTTENHE